MTKKNVPTSAEAVRENAQNRSEMTPSVQPYYAAMPFDPYGGVPYPGGEVSSGLLGEISFRRMLRIVRRKWRLILMVMLFMIMCGGVYYLLAPRVYRASSLVELSVRRPRIAGQQGAVIDDAAAFAFQPEEVFFITRLEKFKGNTMLDAAIAKLKTSTDTSRWSDEKLRALMRRRVAMNLVRRSRLVQISFDYSDKSFATAAANAYAQAAEELALEENKVASDSAVVWLQSQAAAQRKALEKADQALVEFRAKNKIDVMESQKRNAEQSLIDFNKSLTEIESKEVLARDLFNALTRLELKPESAGKLPASMPRAEEIQAMLEKWITAISDRDALLSKYTAQHPAVLAQDKVIEVLRRQAIEAIGRGRETAESNLRLLEKQAGSLRKKIDEQNQLASDLELQIVQRKAELGTLERERDAADISYRGILNRIEEARLSADENTATVKIVEKAATPDNPIKPRWKWILLISLFLGVGLGAVVAIVMDLLEDFVSGADDVERNLKLKILGVLPHLETGQREELATLSLNHKFSQVAETLAGVRGLLDSEQYRDVSRSVLVVSTAPEEGKTITACNLAIMCAKSGMKTLLVDFDMRRPRIERIFKPSESVESLAHVLRAQNAQLFGRLPFKTSCENLEAVMSQSADDISPADFISGRFVKDFIRWAEEHYDRVIIDSPPFGLVSDSAVLAGLTGCAVLVCRINRSRKRAIRQLLHRFNDVGAVVVGVVVNDVPNGRGPLAGYWDSYYGYSYQASEETTPVPKN
jgi:succinoglycan biosynthesis transport protein ExoP